MRPIVQNSLAIVLGLVVGSMVNMSLIMLGPYVISLPTAIDPSDMNSFKENVHLLEAKHYVFPFLAHALGTLVGALTAYKLAQSHKFICAMTIGCLFLVAGIVAASMIPAPQSFVAFDLILAYIPMAWLGIKIADFSKNNQ